MKHLWLSAFALATLASAQPPQPYTWTAVGPMGTARADACAVLLQDGRAMVIGGIGSDGNALASAEFFATDQSATSGAGSGKFSTAPAMNTARAQHSCSLLADGRVLVAGGADGQGNVIAAAEIFDPKAKTWQTIGDLNDPRWGHTATVLQDGRVLLAGGCDAAGVTATLELFDEGPTERPKFTMVANTLSSPRKNFAAALLATGQVLLIGGSDGNNSLFTTDVFDPASTSVGAGSNLLMPRAALTANTLLDGTVLVVGGNDGMQDLASAEIYDPSAQSFSFIFGSLTVPRSGHLAFVIPDNNNVLIVGGMSNGAAQATCELYTLQDEFMPVGSTSTPRAHAAGVAIGPGLVLTAGGRNDEGVELHSGVNTGPSVTFPIPLGGAPAYTTLLIGGTQFKPGEIVNFQLQIKNNSGTQLNTLSPTTANIPSGNFFSQQDLSGLPAGYWTLTAVGQTSGLSASHGLVVLYPTITLSPSCNPCALGQVTLTARVKNASPSLYPGSVGAGDHMVFYDNPTSWGYGFPSLGTVSVIPNSDGSGTAIFTASFSAGTHGIPVDLQPAGADGFFYFVTPYLLTFTVNKAATSINLTASPNPARTDRPVTLQAAIPFTSGNTPPSGTVTFFDGVTQIGMPVLDASSKSAANLSLTTGTHVISAKYAGDANYLASASAAVNVTVNNPITPTVTVTASPNPVTVGQEVSINAVVSYPAGSPAPTGTVTFKAGLTTIGTVPISTVVSTSSVGAVLKLKPSGAGAYKVTATYNGNATYNSATSAPIGLTVIVILL